ncbi:uncharacterized protein LOC135306802 isoform X2 [Passer domesticus]|uniref:uncharacterized protein LOC135306802 isoform X2 n=1 Tax=Passer domesticus TaxID=48849 RepID=UPI0030FED514
MKPRALPALSFSRARLKGGDGRFQQGLCASPVTPGAGPLPAAAGSPASGAGQRPRSGWEGSEDPCSAGSPGKGVPAGSGERSAGAGEEKSMECQRRDRLAQPQSPLVLPAGLQTGQKSSLLLSRQQARLMVTVQRASECKACRRGHRASCCATWCCSSPESYQRVMDVPGVPEVTQLKIRAMRQSGMKTLPKPTFPSSRRVLG